MSTEDNLKLAKDKMDQLGNAFPWAVRRFRKEWRGGTGDIHYDRDVGFSGTWPTNREYEEYKFFDRCLEALTREELVNPILEYLFNLYGIEDKWPDEKPDTSRSTNEGHERCKGFEFIIKCASGRVACLYADPYKSRVDIGSLQRDMKLDEVILIDWSNMHMKVPLKKPIGPLYGERIVSTVTIRTFLNSLFPEEIGDEFSSCISKAVAKANDIIGFHTVPSLSLANLADFKMNVREGLNRYNDREELDKLLIDHAPRWTDLDDDLEMIRRALFDGGVCECLTGDSEFARCFVTSEYLREVFKRGGEFDFTAVICGYLKAVEQLAHALVKCTLDRPDTRGLLIKKRANRHPDNPADAKPWKGSPHVKFRRENEECFDTTLAPLTYLLNGYRHGWRISRDGREYVRDVILEYASRDRNPYFHKANVTALSKVEEIREESLCAILLMLGAYSAGMSYSELREVLGADPVRRNELGYEISPYDDLYEKVFDITQDEAVFILEFNGIAPFKAMRTKAKQLEERDEEGHVMSEIEFVRIDDSANGEKRCLVANPTANKAVVVSANNMPEHVSYCWTDYRGNTRSELLI